MKVEYVILADAAQAVAGKLYMIGGGWNEYHCLSLPTQVRMAVATSLLVGLKETDQTHRVLVTLTDQGGGNLAQPQNVDVTVGKPVDPSNDTRVVIAVNLNIELQRIGQYTVRVTAGGHTAEARFKATLVASKVEVIPPAH